MSELNPTKQLLEVLNQPSPSTCRVETVDFGALGFAEHTKAFAILIRDLLTPTECDALLQAAEATTGGQWSPALINAGGYNVLATDVRLCDRIIWDDRAIAAALLARIRPHLPPDVARLRDRPEITSNDLVWSIGTWEVSRLNERLRFLRYTPGMYFRPHTDGHYMTPSGAEVTFLTVHLYLKGTDDLQGGATRFFGEGNYGEVHEFDVDPAAGACLVFQHHDLTHSGESVYQGTKYTVRSDILYRRVA